MAMAALIACAGDPAFARKRAVPAAPPPLGDLALDAEAPLIDVVLGGVPLRLRVDPGQWDVIELNPDASRRLKLPWRPDRMMEIGRVVLPGRSAQTMLQVAGRTMPVLVADHGRAAVMGADGIVGPDLLPYPAIEWRRAAAPAPTQRTTLPLALGATTGLSADAALPVPIRLRFSLMRPQSEATAAAGSLLIQRYGGDFAGPAMPLTVLFGINRPARPLRLGRAPLIAGFRFATIAVRIDDFRGDNPLPPDPRGPDEIVVAGKDNPQPAQSWITLARDRLGACAAITYRAQPRSLTLDCAFDR